MKKIFLTSSLLLSVSLVLSGCAAGIEAPLEINPTTPSATDENSDSPGTEEAPRALTLGELLADPVSDRTRVTFGDWTFHSNGLYLDRSNSFVQWLNAPATEAGYAWGIVQLNFEYSGTGDADSDLNNFAMFVSSPNGDVYNVPAGPEVYQATGYVPDDQLKANGTIKIPTIFQIPADATELYLIVDYPGAQSVAVKLNIVTIK